MYQGKFDSKKKQATVDVSELVAQRNTVPAKQAARPSGQKPAAAKAQPGKAPAAPVKKKKGPRLGGTIFYTLYFLFILLFFVATFFGLIWLRGWLVDYEAAQPTTKSQEVFQQLFTSPDWGALYDSAGTENTAYEGREAYVSYMQEKVGSQSLTMKETSAGLSGGKMYNILLGKEKVASFTLVDLNSDSSQTSIPQWQLSKVEIFFDRNEVFYIQTVDGHTVLVNGVALGDDATIQVATTVAAEEYLPIGVTGVSMRTMQVEGLLSKPEVTVFDDKGTQMEVSYDEASRTFIEQTTSNTISSDEQSVALKAAETYCKYMIEKASRADIANCFDASSEIYTTITRLGNLWMQGNNGFEFKNESVTNYARYSDDLFSVYISLDLVVTRTDGTERTFDFDQSLFFRKQSTGRWLCFAMTNKDVSAPVGKVRLTFMDGSTKLTSDLYPTDATKLSTPLVSVPEGKVFSGWYRIDTDETGKVSYNMVFDPDENGNVTIPAGTTLEPMTLYTLFEDAATTEGA